MQNIPQGLTSITTFRIHSANEELMENKYTDNVNVWNFLINYLWNFELIFYWIMNQCIKNLN